MKLIVGLGNPGERYQNNRHNVGFMFADYLLQVQSAKFKVQSCSLKFKFNKYLLSEICEIPPLNSSLITPYPLDILLAKPQTYMNKSGQAVSKLIKNYELRIMNDLIVVHDDLDILLGKFKIQTGTGPQLHNGIDSINANLKTHNYLRIRIGVDARPPENRINGETYILQDFMEEEFHLLKLTIFNQIKLQITNFL